MTISKPEKQNKAAHYEVHSSQQRELCSVLFFDWLHILNLNFNDDHVCNVVAAVAFYIWSPFKITIFVYLSLIPSSDCPSTEKN